MCNLYTSPGSSYFNPDTYLDLENDIAILNEDGHIMLAGDFNATTACALDYNDSDNCPHIPGDNLFSQQNLKGGKNFDNHISEHGNSLPDMCKTCDLRIEMAYQRVHDSFGKITYHSPV